jgi:hypothetical protein
MDFRSRDAVSIMQLDTINAGLGGESAATTSQATTSYGNGHAVLKALLHG